MKFKFTLSGLSAILKTIFFMATLFFCSSLVYGQFNGTSVSIEVDGSTYLGPFTMNNTSTKEIDISGGTGALLLSIDPVASQVKLNIYYDMELAVSFDVVFAGGNFASINTIALNTAASSSGMSITASRINSKTIRVYPNGHKTTYTDKVIVWDFTASAAVLPVELRYFEVAKQPHSVLLHWKTESEQHNKGFDIYRSGNGQNFVKLENLKGKGVAADYTFTDKSPLNGYNYYRLVQLDNNGRETELGVRNIAFSIVQQEAIVFPNPAVNKLTVNFQPGSFNSSELLDLNGNVLQQMQLKRSDTRNFFDLSSLPKGVYTVRLKGKGKMSYQKVIRL